MSIESPKIAVVDDEADLLELYENYLQDNFKVHCFTNGADVVAGLAQDPDFDCVVSDFRMPIMDGIQLLEELQNRDIEVPVVIATGFADKKLAIDCLQAGAFALIEKPIKPQELFYLTQRAAVFRQLLVQNQKLLDFYQEMVARMKTPEMVIKVLDDVKPYVDKLSSQRDHLRRLQQVLRKAS